jgi:hypothetical protein
MEAKTSQQAYEEYQKLKNLEEKLEKNNRGLNIVNSDKFFKPSRFFINVKKISKVNLKEVSSKISVNTNFPFADWTYSYGDVGVEGFLNQLKKWALTPRYNYLIQHNRKRDNQASSWDLPKFKNFEIKFEEIDFDIGEEAQHEINLMGFDFILEVKNLLSQQREATDEEAEDFEKFKTLVEEIDNLKRQLPSSSSYYSYGQDKDNSLKITISAEDYNSKLKIVETELKTLCKKYSFLKMPSINYKEIKVQVKFEDWIKEHDSKIRESWDNFDDSDREDWDGDFNSYAQNCFENYDGEDSSDEEEDFDEEE